ncbi:hypothetical protein EC973_004981 [Apophysomyces ossiformis]|uniref:Pleckstrin homology domain-containing protein n=1 Tax=Apophysomyces ossiformis TaxID=679940 RepID=A0A8H7BFL4_9FUNG|nr:hypothetical protein EC973_004981 [Apophysomyces ossiformis]
MSNVTSHSFSEDKSPTTSNLSFSGLKVNEIILELKDQLDNNERMLNNMSTTGTGRNALLRQTAEIRRKIQDLNGKLSDEELSPADRGELEALANEFHLVKNAAQSREDSMQLLLPPSTISTPIKQRGKTPHVRKNTDIRFATEIGQGLLIEVRKLQAALQEKEEAIKQLEIRNADKERDNESILKHMRLRNEAEEKLKEENWNLEVANQELRTKLVDISQANTKLTNDYTKTSKQLQISLEQIEALKTQEERARSATEAIKLRHEQDAQTLRRNIGSLQRTNTQMQKQMEMINTELKICKAKLAVKMAANSRQHPPFEEVTPNTITDNDQSITASLPGGSSGTQTTPAHSQALESETLKQSLAHAHRIISNLRSSLHKERIEKIEIKKVLSDSQETIEQMRREQIAWGNGAGVNAPRKATTARKRVGRKRMGVSRQPRGLTGHTSASTDEDTQSESEGEKSDSFDSSEVTDQRLWNGENPLMLEINGPTMKSLSSELESFANKVVVESVDAAVNTENSWLPNMTAKHEDAAVRHDNVMLNLQTASPTKLRRDDRQELISVDAFFTTPRYQIELSDAILPSITQLPERKRESTHIESRASDVVQINEEKATFITGTSQYQTSAVLNKHTENALSSCRDFGLATLPDNSDSVTEQARIAENAQQPIRPLSATLDEDQVTQLAIPIADLLQNKKPSNSMPFKGDTSGENEQSNQVVTENIELSNVSQGQSVDEKQLKIASAEIVARKDDRSVKEPHLLGLSDDHGISQVETLDNVREPRLSIRNDDHIKSFSSVTLDSFECQPLKSFEPASQSKYYQLSDVVIPALSLAPRDQIPRDKQFSLISKTLEHQDIEPADNDNLHNKMEIYSTAVLPDSGHIEPTDPLAAHNEMNLHSTQVVPDSGHTESTNTFTEQNERKLCSAQLVADCGRMEPVSPLIVYSETRLQPEFGHTEEPQQVNEGVECVILPSNQLGTENKSPELSTCSRRHFTIHIVPPSSDGAQDEGNAKPKSHFVHPCDQAIQTEENVTGVQTWPNTFENDGKKVSYPNCISACNQAIQTEGNDRPIATELSTPEKDRIEVSSRHSVNSCDQAVQTEETERFIRADSNNSEKNRVEVHSRLSAKAKSQMNRQVSIQSLRPPRPVNTGAPAPAEKSVSTSRLAKISNYLKPSPSASTPANSNRPLRTSSSMVSLRSHPSRQNSISARQQREPESSSFGNVRIIEHRKYRKNPLNSDAVPTSHSTREKLRSQKSVTSLSTMSSDDIADHASMSSERNFMDSIDGTDMDTISAITQTMIGEWLWKHTRRHVGGGISEHKHKRFVWVHPYTRTLYWGATEPGMDGNEAKAKSAFIESVSSVSSCDNGASPMSLLIRTTKRDLKLTATNIERHELWLKSLSYLLGRPSYCEDTAVELLEPQVNLTEDETERRLVEGTQGGFGYESDESEDLLNVRQCCDGRHDLSTLSRHGSTHHHHQ